MYESYNPSQIFSYYPRYDYLDNVLAINNKKKLNLFIDVKGCATSLFQEWAVKIIVTNSQGNQIDTSLFSAVLQFIAYHKEYAVKRDIDLNIYFFMESGKSTYHLDIYKDYKANRKSTDLFGLDLPTKELFFKVLDTNYTVLERIVNKIPNCCFIRLKYLEADFVPYYLLKYGLKKEDVDNSVNIIYSNDKDMYQCLFEKNIYQFCRSYKHIKMVSHEDIYDNWIKVHIDSEKPASWFPLILAILGDSSDGFNGVFRIGPSKLKDCFEDIKGMCGNSMENVYYNIHHKLPIFQNPPSVPVTKNLNRIYQEQEVITRNVKLASYQLICDEMNEGYPAYMGERKHQIQTILENDVKIPSARVLYAALNRSGLMGILNDKTINDLFLEKKQIEGTTY